MFNVVTVGIFINTQDKSLSLFHAILNESKLGRLLNVSASIDFILLPFRLILLSFGAQLIRIAFTFILLICNASRLLIFQILTV
jgi:hypothetical protein